MSISFWVTVAITLISAGVSFGFSIAALRTDSTPVRTAAKYGFARSLAVLVGAVVAAFTGSVEFVAAVALIMTIVQLADAVVGITLRDRMKTVGPAVLGVANLAALIWMLLG